MCQIKLELRHLAFHVLGSWTNHLIQIDVALWQINASL